MERTRAFKRAQKQIDKVWEKSWLSINARLDIILNAMNHQGLEKETYEQILERTNRIDISIKEIVQLVQKMVTDGYVTEEKNGATSIFYISANGKLFIEKGGYVNRVKRESRNNIWKWLSISGNIASGSILLYIAIVSFYKDNNEAPSKDNKQSISSYINLVPSIVPVQMMAKFQPDANSKNGGSWRSVQGTNFAEAGNERSALNLIEDSTIKIEKYFKVLDLYSNALRLKEVDRNFIFCNRGGLKFSFNDYVGAIEDLSQGYKDDNLNLILAYCYIKTNQIDSASKYLDLIIKANAELAEYDDTTKKSVNKAKLRFDLPPIEEFKVAVSYALYYKGIIEIFQDKKNNGCRDLSKSLSLDTTVARYAYESIRKFCN